MGKTFEQKAAMVLKSMEQDRQKLLMRQPFIGMILMNLELVPMPDDKVGTASTDGVHIMMGISFYATLDLEERLFVLAHEAWHCVLMHGVRCQTRNHNQFNIAADLEIHFVLREEGMKEPYVLPHNPAWAGLSAEEIYERLGHRARRWKNGANPSSGQHGDVQDPGKTSEHIHGKNGQGFDEHIYTDGQADQEKAGTNSNSSGGDSSAEQPSWDRQSVERMRRIIIQTAQVVERTQGHLPAHIQDIVERLRKPELPWRELLRQFVTSCYGGSRRWLPPERRYVSRGLYLPSYRDNRLNAVMAIDTSGSTTGDLPQFFGELSGLLNSFGKYDLTVIQCDCVIQHTEIFSDARHFPRNYQWRCFGHGGTSLVPPFEYVKRHNLKPDVFIYLTDGLGNVPGVAPPYPVLWVLAYSGKTPATWGRSIKLKSQTEENKSYATNN